MAEYSRAVSPHPTAIWNWRTLDLRLVLERWSQAVPHERIHVLPLDRTAAREEIWHRFGGLLGLDTAAYDLSQSFPNESMGVVEAEPVAPRQRPPRRLRQGLRPRRLHPHLPRRRAPGAAQG
ncbi:hypothetical protein G5V59_08985 [Nocardioides sp. W3-2-3]|uniref:hypothetical protein n=1 Tax=Nocardioides convexus TaxID=2712224 RepID=UPI0024188941|nr:hypothetical protein [Nocardioides convexus]NHA00220.1 hypothetical protein [Nocardioides convexus]